MPQHSVPAESRVDTDLLLYVSQRDISEPRAHPVSQRLLAEQKGISQFIIYNIHRRVANHVLDVSIDDADEVDGSLYCISQGKRLFMC